MDIMKKKDNFDFEVNTGRVKVAKEIRKVKERKDSLDDHSSDSDEDDFFPKKRGRLTKEEDKAAEKARVEARQ